MGRSALVPATSMIFTASPRTEIVRGQSFADYCAAPGVNQSLLKTIAPEYDGCPALLRYRSEHPDQRRSPALSQGRALHCYILEPQAFSARYKVLGAAECELIFTKIKAKGGKSEACKYLTYADWNEANGAKGFTNTTAYKAWVKSDSREPITGDFAESLNGMAEAISSNQDVADELRGVTARDYEVSLFAPYQTRDGESFQLKARVDILCRGDALIDLKSARTTSPRKFARDVAEYGYDIQGAFYLSVANECGLEKKRFGFLAQEKTAPYLNCVHWLPDDWLKYARLRYKKLLSDLAECVRIDLWEGPSSGMIEPPDFLAQEIEMVSA